MNYKNLLDSCTSKLPTLSVISETKIYHTLFKCKSIKDRYLKTIQDEFYFSNFDFSSKTKFMKLLRLLESPFVSCERILTIFCNIQKMVNAVHKLKTTWRWKRAILYNTDDLFMTPICQTYRNTIVLLQNNTKYVFHLRELLRVVQTSLSHCCHFFPEPVDCKNPYTNLPFNKSALYNFYFALRRSSYNIPPLLEAFFQTNFNYNEFALNNEELINTEYLKTYVENHCLDKVLSTVEEMFQAHHFKSKIHKTFSSDKLMTVMKPYLELFFVSQYSVNQHKRMRSHRILHKKLHEFMNFNPNFGRRKVKIVKKNPFSLINKCEYVYDDRYMPFYRVVQEQFLQSHLHASQIHTTEQEETESESEAVFTDDDSDDENEVIIINNSLVQPDISNDDDSDDNIEEDNNDVDDERVYHMDNVEEMNRMISDMLEQEQEQEQEEGEEKEEDE